MSPNHDGRLSAAEVHSEQSERLLQQRFHDLVDQDFQLSRRAPAAEVPCVLSAVQQGALSPVSCSVPYAMCGHQPLLGSSRLVVVRGRGLGAFLALPTR